DLAQVNTNVRGRCPWGGERQLALRRARGSRVDRRGAGVRGAGARSGPPLGRGMGCVAMVLVHSPYALVKGRDGRKGGGREVPWR
ncbi:MAG: hypothetical protein SGPRY_007172, partial [Prymnesium sp.]